MSPQSQRAHRRQPSGVPAGGQFAPDERPEVEHIDLSGISDDEYNDRATFAFPPVPRNADQVIDFWLNVDIPDDALQRVVRDRQRVIDERRFCVAPWAWSVDPTKRPPMLMGPRARKRRRNELAWRRWAEETKPYPPQELRHLCRMAGMYWDAERLDPDGCQRVRSCVFTSEGGLTGTPEQVVAWYELESVRQAIHPG